MKYKFLQIIFLSILVLGLASCGKKGGKEKGGKEKPPALVDILVAQNQDFENIIEVNGSVLSNEMVELRPEISGRLVQLNIPDGEKVAEGTILAKINDADLQAQLEQQKSQLDLAQKNEKRLNELLKINGINQADYDAVINQVNSIKANIKVINAQIEKTIIKAPFAGTLGLRMVSNGAYVTPQTLIGTLQQTDEIKIDFTVPEGFSSLIEKGKQVLIQVNESSANKTATISAIEPQINVTTRNIKVRAKLEKGFISPGAFVKVLLVENKKGIIVPSNAIIPDAKSNQLVVIEQGKAVFKNVETGNRMDEMVEIKSGINIGDSVVIYGVLFVKPDAVVKIRKTKKK